MCGITGFVSLGSSLSRETLQRMNDVIWRRGPDGEGFLQRGPIGLAMRRLAIIDLSGGQQPVYNEDHSIAVVFNGEIYNYRALRQELLQQGHQFTTHSDTEVIVHLYEQYGTAFVSRLEGMFAFALLDSNKELLLLGRDRLGIKPLFLAQLPEGILFGSEIKSLLSTGLVPRDLDWQAIDEFLTYTFIPTPRSIYRAIRKLPPGTLTAVDRQGRIRTEPYWQIPDSATLRRSDEEWVGCIEATLRRAVESHLVSDVPVGAFLSGGIDSGLMVALMAQATERPVETFTVGFGDAGSAFIDERAYARQIAERYRLNHHEITVEPRVVDIMDDVVSAFDEPFADDSVVPSYYVSKVAAEHVKVALTGLGGDELFAGYRRHLGVRVGDLYGRVPAVLRNGIFDPLIQRIPEPRNSSDFVDHLKRFSRSACGDPASRYQDSMAALTAAQRAELLQPEIRAHVDSHATERVITGRFAACRNGTSVDRALNADLGVYLVDDILTLTDRLSMWHSLELRVPYLDHRLVEEAMTIPATAKIRGLTQKYILKKLAAKWLPDSVINHRKQGFEAPMGRWLRTSLRPLMEETLSRRAIEADGIFNAEVVRRLMDEHIAGVHKHSKVLFSMLMFQLWNQQPLVDSGAPSMRVGVSMVASN